MNKVKKGYLFNIISVAIMSLTPILNKLSLTDLSPIQASFFNALFSTLILLITVLFDKSKIKIYHNKSIWLLGITNTIGILLQYVSLSLLDPVSVGLLGRFYIIFALFLSVLFLNETLRKHDTLPIIFAIIGSFLITHFSGDFNSILGVIAALSYTFFFALTNMLAKKTVKDIDSKTILLYNQATSTLLLGIILIVTNHLHTIHIGIGLFSILLSALCSGVIGLLLFYEGLKYISFREANIIRTLNPIFVFIFSFPFFPLPLTPKFITGAILIIISIIYMNLYKDKKTSS
ncbi:DMT family transporter [Staphylococcus haemolyticus]|uniref:DMT family transporter n=1 Tax=Staphylococcus TaxID=1279 RepID=UPI00122DEFC2|nr:MULTISPECIES: DMT family transporter [Staphylococcus]KAA2273961.1 DMT family transporter [Staphylococcus sp. GDX7P312P]KAA2280410.1 DMT family transporter [Staphylococcus sp. GDX7P459A]MCE4953959.1 DMT family transporter [Staphylococcus haemolyticus]MCH4457112.1 DMT family transporter [Staphylococcus haemolyticus]MCH4491315.1 DMT family transporter [Staphylococcus haemolyticus]